MTPDDRPDNWGVCAVCGADCPEANYSELTRTSTCDACLQRQYRRLAAEVLDEGDVEALLLKGDL